MPAASQTDKKPSGTFMHCEKCGGRFPFVPLATKTHFLAYRVVASADGTDKTLVMQACGPLVPDP